MPQNRRFLLKRRPDGEPVRDDFELTTEDTPALEEGQFLIRNHYASLDPAMRGWMDDAESYMPPIPLGAPVRASTIGRVAESRAAGFEPGQWVMGLNAIEDYSVGQEGGFTQAIDTDAVPEITNYLSLFGAVGMTAFFGLLEVCEPKEGETVLVTGAAGAVGSIVGQLAKIQGCRAVGIAGGPEKCARLTERYGYDAAIDYRGLDEAALTKAIGEAAPDGVDVIFENVGGVILDAGLNNLNHHARDRAVRPHQRVQHRSARRAQTVAANRQPRLDPRAAGRRLCRAVRRGRGEDGRMGGGRKDWWSTRISMRGSRHAYDAFMKLFSGGNQGKMILKLAD